MEEPVSDSKYPPKAARPVDDADAEIARLTRRCEGFKAELNAVQELRRQEKLRVIDIALDLAQSSDVGHWTIAERLREAVDVPGHPDDVKAASA
jgi:hypothetical protein